MCGAYQPEPETGSLAGRPGSSLSLDALAGDSVSVGSLRLADGPAAVRGCERCAGSETQLQQLQTELRTAEKRRAELGRALERHQQDLSREGRYRRQTEQQWQQLAEQYQAQVSPPSLSLCPLPLSRVSGSSWPSSTRHRSVQDHSPSVRSISLCH